MKKNKKKVVCLKCHKEFETELDDRNIPYNRLCYSCRVKNKKQRFVYKDCRIGE